MINKVRSVLRDVFGYDKFRPLQAEIIQTVLSQKDTLVVMPTGGGKSLCYQIPALIFDGLTLVISPLISLMKDQVEQLVQCGVDAAFLNSSLSPEAYSTNLRRVKQASLKLLYLAPEALLKPGMLELLSGARIDCLTIDEAHCISEWGHDFRPEYRELTAARALFPKTPCVALTATATPRVRADIQTNLKMDDCREFIASFNRENLFIEITPKYDPVQQTIRFLRRFPDQSGIIYCFSRKQVEDLNAALEDEGFAVKPYHAGMTDELRSENQELFIRDDIQIMVATIAFGMGIDKPNVRFVVHFDLPQNIESYYQQIGRAGRDGLRSHCLMLFSYADVQKIKYFINQKQAREKRVANIHLGALLRFAETQDCRRIPLLNYFAEDYTQESCNMCDNCLSEEKQKVDVTIAAQKFLSCVKRTEERFGAHHIIDVLRGSKARKVIRFGHQHLSTYGIGKEYSKKQWLQLSRQFLHSGLITQDLEVGNFRLSDKAWEVMRNHEKVYAQLENEQAEDLPVLESLNDDAPDYDRIFFEQLRNHRKTMADEARIPPFVIFSDRSLIEMATYFPRTREQFLDIHGVGAVKYDRYGEQFLDLIDRYCRQHDIESPPKRSPKPRSSRPKKAKADKAPAAPQKSRYMLVAEEYDDGDTIDTIMARYGIKQGTVFDHLLKYLLTGKSVRSDGLLSCLNLTPEQIELALDAFDTVGTDYLKPAHDVLDGRIDYEDLKVLRVYYLSMHRSASAGRNMDSDSDSVKEV